MFIKHKTIINLFVFVTGTLFFNLNSALFSQESIPTTTLPPFESSTVEQTTPDSTINSKEDTTQLTPIDNALEENSKPAKNKNKSKNKKEKSSKDTDQVKDEKVVDTAKVPPTPPFKPDPMNTSISFQLDLLGLTTFISFDSHSLVRVLHSGFTGYYKLKPVSSKSLLLLDLGYLAFNTYSDTSSTNFDLNISHYFAGATYKQKIANQFSILGSINLGLTAYKKYYIV